MNPKAKAKTTTNLQEDLETTNKPTPEPPYDKTTWSDKIDTTSQTKLTPLLLGATNGEETNGEAAGDEAPNDAANVVAGVILISGNRILLTVNDIQKLT